MYETTNRLTDTIGIYDGQTTQPVTNNTTTTVRNTVTYTINVSVGSNNTKNVNVGEQESRWGFLGTILGVGTIVFLVFKVIPLLGEFSRAFEVFSLTLG